MTARRMLFGMGGRSSTPADLVAGARIDVDTGSGYKSFPGMAYRSGRLHLVYRHGTDHFNAADGIIKYRHSDDLGATWSAATTLVSTGGRDLRDPSITCLASGRLVVGYDDTLHTGPVYSTIKVIYSDDGGSTWSSAYTVPSTGMAYECAGTSQMVELEDGTLILPAFGQQAITDPYFTVLFKSTDGGETFGTQTTIAQHVTDSRAEPQVRLMPSGQLVCFSHAAVDGPVIYRQTSGDDGATWSAPEAVLAGGGRTDWVWFAPRGLAMWLRDPGGDGSDARWTVSSDVGYHWAALRDIDGSGDNYEYSAPVVVNGDVIVVYSIESSSSDADLYCRTYQLAA